MEISICITHFLVTTTATNTTSTVAVADADAIIANNDNVNCYALISIKWNFLYDMKYL